MLPVPGAEATQHVAPGVTNAGALSKRTIWIAAALVGVTVVAIGVAFQFLNGSGEKAPGASVATFVGSETCAACHQA